MLIAALDCTGESWSVALARGSEVLAELVCRHPRTQLRSLTPSLGEVARLAGVELSQCDRLAVTLGPGSFTGVRLGVLIARTLAQALEKPIVGVDALQALAAGCVTQEVVVAASDVRKGEVVAAAFRAGERLTPNALLSARDWPDWLAQQGECLVTGNALERYGQLPSRARAAARPFWWVRAGQVALLARDGTEVSWSQLEPAYVRAAEVQIHSGGSP
ncbi:MAG: hypothetical protein AMXMBFR33_54930 [Candidatus Xenobia bacterium]